MQTLQTFALEGREMLRARITLDARGDARSTLRRDDGFGRARMLAR